MKEEKFKINCKNCGSDKIQTTLESDSGYSNWTVLGSGKIAFKCHGCGKYGSTDDYEEPNELSNFTVRCLKCNSIDDWKYNIQDVEGSDTDTSMWCNKCGNKLTEDESPPTP